MDDFLFGAFFGVISILLVATCGCSSETKKLENTESVWGGPTLSTVEYDGHKFIWAREQSGTGYSGNLLHHPDCRCQK